MTATARPKVIVLGAGKPLTGDAPAGLRLVTRQAKVVDWIAHAFRGEEPELVFVGGYHLPDLSTQIPDGITVISNPDWATTGSVASLFRAGLKAGTDNYVCYGDILFREDLVEALKITPGGAAAIDTETLRLRQGTAETLWAEDGRITGDGRGVMAEYVGVWKIPADQVGQVQELSKDRILANRHIGHLIRHLVTAGVPVAAVPAQGKWSSLDDDAILTRFVLGTKADTLMGLSGRLETWRVGPQVTLTVGDLRQDADAAVGSVLAAFSGVRLAVRSSALCEDGFEESNAGRFTSLLNVPADPVSIREALYQVAASYPAGNPGDQILIQPMVRNVVASGVVLTRSLGSGAPYFSVSYAEGRDTDVVTSGKGAVRRLTVYRNADHLPEDAPAFLSRLLDGLRELEYVADYDALDVEFAVCEAGDLHLLQARPLVLPHHRTGVTDHNIATLLEEAAAQLRALTQPAAGQAGHLPAWGVMPDWNPAEIIGIRPGPLSFSLYRHVVTDEVWARQRAEFGYRDVRPAPLVRLFAGHAYVDVRASFNSFLPAGLPDPLAEKLVTHFVTRLRSNPQWHDKVEFEIVPTCASFDMAPVWDRLAADAGLTPAELALYETQLWALTRRGISQIEDPLALVETLERQMQAILAAGMAPLETARALLHLCRACGSLPFAHLARHGFIAVTLLRSAVSRGALTPDRLSAFMQSLHTVARDLTRDALAVKAGRLSWDRFVALYGHLRPGTYEICSPCYADNPEGYLRGLVEEATDTAAAPFVWTPQERAALQDLLSASQLDLTFEAFERYLRLAIEGRESSKFRFTKALSQAIECLARWGRDHGLSRDDLSHLPFEAMMGMAAGNSAADGVAALARQMAEGNRRWRSLVEQIELPPLLFRDEDLLAFSYPQTMPNFITNARIVAPLVNLAGQAGPVQEGLAGRIVLVPQADPGYDWLFGHRIAGLITIYGGANSHMAIRAAEFGLPAAIGIGEERYRDLLGARMVELDCSSRQIFGQT